MEEDKDEHTETDNNAIMSKFFNFRARYCEDRKALRESEGIVRTQQEQLRLSREAENSEHRKANHYQKTLKQQQELIDNLLGVNEKNVRLVQEGKQLTKDKEELLSRMKADSDSYQKGIESLKEGHKKELEDLRSVFDRKVQEARADLDVHRAEYDMKRNEMDATFQALRKEKSEELNITTLIYEEKIHKMEQDMTTIQHDHQQKDKENAATISMYKKKVVELERKLMQAEIEARRKAAPPLKPQYLAQNSSYRYNNNSVLPPAILKKTSTVYLDNPTPTKSYTPWRNDGKGSSNANTGGKGRSNIQPLDFVEDSCQEETPKKVTFSATRKRKLYNPNEDDL